MITKIEILHKRNDIADDASQFTPGSRIKQRNCFATSMASKPFKAVMRKSYEWWIIAGDLEIRMFTYSHTLQRSFFKSCSMVKNEKTIEKSMKIDSELC